MRYEDVIEDIGSFGPYQWRIFLFVSAFETPAAWAMLLPVFSQAKVNWECPWNSTMNGTQNMNGSVCSEAGTLCDGAISMSYHTSIISDFQLACDKSYLPSLITTCQMVGVLVGACITGQIADTFGRRLPFFIVYTLLLTFSFILSFANSWQMYMTCRVLIGMFFGGTMVINFVLPLEFVGAKWRTFCGCIGFWACGVMSQALLAYLLPNWRHLSLACSLGGLFLLLTWWFIPESPRWLLQKGRRVEAEIILTAIAKFNKKPVPDFSKLDLYIPSPQPSKTSQHSYIDLCRSPGMTRNTFIMIYAWFVSSAVYYGTSLNVGNLTGNRYLNFFLSGLVEIPALIFVVLINNRVGRRVTMSSLMSVAGLSMLGILLVERFDAQNEFPQATLTLSLIGRSGIAGGWAAVQVMCAELFPTVVRNIGVASSSMAARVGGIVAPQIVRLTVISPSVPYIVFGCMALACGVLSWFLPETRGRPLPDTLPSNAWCSPTLEDKEEQEEIEVIPRSLEEEERMESEIGDGQVDEKALLKTRSPGSQTTGDSKV